MKIITKIIKKILITISMIYTVDVLLEGVNVFIPINFPNIIVGTILGPLGITSLIIILLITR
jgi:hypothetical protein